MKNYNLFKNSLYEISGETYESLFYSEPCHSEKNLLKIKLPIIVYVLEEIELLKNKHYYKFLLKDKIIYAYTGGSWYNLNCEKIK